MATEAEQGENVIENIQLKEDDSKSTRCIEKVEHHAHSAGEKSGEDERDELHEPGLSDSYIGTITERAIKYNKLCQEFVGMSMFQLLLIVLVPACVIIAHVLIVKPHDGTLQSPVSAITSNEESVSTGTLPFASENIRNSVQETLQKYHLSIGMRQDNNLQECQRSEYKQSFPDVDYALLGYNILKGFPLATGHDPGFTFPIFRHDYSTGGMTADCRYSVPRGLVIIPDVSCVTSFSSTVIQTKYEFSKSLAVSASVSGGGWGVSFSASAGYKESLSQVSTGESVFILSSAHCNNYFSKLITEEAPEFDRVFVKWTHKLNKSGLDSQLYFQFFDKYGTHFPTEVTFGARFTYVHKMSSSKYESETTKGVNVAVQASYSGLFSVGGGFNLDSDQRQAASEFAKSVETKTITAGAAPPANGDAMTWASEVKKSPVPTAYTLSSIEFLFTERYMGKLNVDYERIRSNILTMKKGYCLYLRNQGKINSCDTDRSVKLANTKIHYTKSFKLDRSSECIDKCLNDIDCVALSTCTTCRGDSDPNCFMAIELLSSAVETASFQSIIFPDKLKSQIVFDDSRINGVPRGFDKTTNLDQCRELCIKDVHCDAYTHCDCLDKIVKCNMYSKEYIYGMKKEIGTQSFFISSRRKDL